MSLPPRSLPWVSPTELGAFILHSDRIDFSITTLDGLFTCFSSQLLHYLLKGRATACSPLTPHILQVLLIIWFVLNKLFKDDCLNIASTALQVGKDGDFALWQDDDGNLFLSRSFYLGEGTFVFTTRSISCLCIWMGLEPFLNSVFPGL